MRIAARSTPVAAGIVASRLAMLLVAVASTACFSEPADPSACPTGDRGCPCSPGAACSEGLACEESIDRCIVDGCDPGTELCVCSDGACLGTLVCEDGLCMPSAASSGDTNAGSGSASQGSTTTAETTGTADESTTLLDTGLTTGVDVTSDSGGPMNCRMCLSDAAESDACAVQQLQCGSKCQAIFACFQSPDHQNCCATGDAPDHVQWNAVALCAAAECPGCMGEALTCP